MSFGGTLGVESGLLAVPGADSAGVRVFRGIHYAAPSVGRLRWRPPEAPIPWARVRPVDRFGANAMRARVYDDLDSSTPHVSEFGRSAVAARNQNVKRRLRKWFGHDPTLWEEFRRSFAKELHAHVDRIDQLRDVARHGTLILVYSAHDEQHNNAIVLREFLLTR